MRTHSKARRLITHKSGAQLVITVKDKDGNITGQQVKECDLYLDQWGAMIASLLKYSINSADSTVYACKDTSGAALNLGGSNASYGDAWGTISASTLRVQIGTAGSGPAHTDYADAVSVTPVGTPSVPQVTVSGNQLIITFSCSISPTSTPVTITEAVIYVSVYNSAGATKQAAFTHDLFSVAVGSSGSITLAYSFTFN